MSDLPFSLEQCVNGAMRRLERGVPLRFNTATTSAAANKASQSVPFFTLKLTPFERENQRCCRFATESVEEDLGEWEEWEGWDEPE